MIADLHCHPTLPALNTKADIWNFDPPTPDERSKLANTTAISGFTQGDYTSLCKAKTRLVFNALYPVEQGFLCSKFPILKKDGKDGFFKKVVKAIARSVDTGKFDWVLRRVLSKIIYNMTTERFVELTSAEHSYFEDLKLEHKKFLQQSVKPHIIDGLAANIQVIQNYNQLKRLLSINSNYEIGALPKNTVAVIFSVEGAHSLGCGQKNTPLANDITTELTLLTDLNHPQTQAFTSALKNNVRSLKKLGPGGIDDDGSHCPFYITFTHHFWNQLCGSAMSYANPANKIFDQLNGLTTGFTKVGLEVLDELLSNKNGKRIFIDIKHMSREARMEYYRLLKDKYTDENIPIIASHMGANGIDRYDSATYPAKKKINVPNDMDDAYDSSDSIFNIWDINLFDDDIINIHLSDGIIGLNFDQRILAGRLQIKHMAEVSKSMFDQLDLEANEDGDYLNDEEIDNKKLEVINHPIYRSIWSTPIVNNILHVVKTITNSNVSNPELAWERICIGSDFDGLINSLDAYCHAQDFEILRTILIQKFKQAILYEPLLKVQNIEELVDGFMYKNLFKFLERHF